MRLEAWGDDLRITFEGGSQERFAAVWSACIDDEYSYPPELHDLRPYGIDVKERYISVGLCNDREVLWRIRMLMERLERDFGLAVDEGVKRRIADWSEPVMAFCDPAKKEHKGMPLKADIPDRCVGCRYRYMKKRDDCKLFLMMGDEACE